MRIVRTVGAACLLALLAAAPLAAAQQAPVMTPRDLRAALASPNTDAADRVAAWFGRANLSRGPNAKSDELEVAWAIEAPGAQAAPRVVSQDGAFTLPLTRLGTTDTYAGVATLTDGAAMLWAYEVDGKRVGDWRQLEVYKTHPDSRERSGVPKGKLTQQPRWKSHVFEGTERDWWVYVPAQYKPDTPACVMVFQDGASYKDYVPTVFDNLIAKGDMPVTVGVFLNPGEGTNGRRNRSFEYDTLSDQYARFLLDEILPEVEKTVKLRQDPAGRAICGASSGGICAFTVAWEKPDRFGKVVSWIGSFTNIASGASKREGGHNYPALIRKTDRKPIRVFLQDGANDLDNVHGSWPLANQQMAKALAFKGYDYQFVWGNGFHSHRHGRAIFPDTLRWLWRDHKPPVAE